MGVSLLCAQAPIIWNVPTCILYGEHDNLTSIETVSAFAKLHHVDLPSYLVASIGSIPTNRCSFWTNGSESAA